MKGCALVLPIVLAGGYVAATRAESRAATANVVRLKAISSRVTSTGTSLVIEASEPVPYVATRPDPLTLYIDFRNVAADGITNVVAAALKGPIEGVAVEPADPIGEGSPRVRVRLSQPVAHRVRSERNTVVIDFDRTAIRPVVATPTAVPVAARTQTAAPQQAQTLATANPGAVDPIAALGLDRSTQSDRRAVPAGLLAQSNAAQPAAQQIGRAHV